MTISRRKLFSFLPAAASVPVVATGMLGSSPRDLVINAPGITVEGSHFSREALDHNGRIVVLDNKMVVISR